MQKWIAYALLSSLFAGATAIFAKVGLKEVGATLALGIRTAFIFLFVVGLVLFSGSASGFKNLRTYANLSLGLSS